MNLNQQEIEQDAMQIINTVLPYAHYDWELPAKEADLKHSKLIRELAAIVVNKLIAEYNRMAPEYPRKKHWLNVLEYINNWNVK